MISIFNSTTTTSKLSKMNCTHFGQNVHKNNEKWCYLQIFVNKKIRHLEKNSWIWKYFKMWSLIYWKVVEEKHETLRPNEIKPWGWVISNLQNERWWQFFVNNYFHTYLLSKKMVFAIFYLRLKNEFQPFPPKPGLWLADPAGEPIRGLDFGGKCLEFISQINGDYNFHTLTVLCFMALGNLATNYLV